MRFKLLFLSLLFSVTISAQTHYNVIVECIAQSDLDRRINRATEPSYLNDNIVDNVSVWNGTTLTTYSLLVNGPTGDGSTFVAGAASSANLYGFEPMALKMIGDYLPNLALVKVSSGGSRLAVEGANNANGSWNPDYTALNAEDPTMPRLLEDFEDRFNDFDAWATLNGHTYTVVAAIIHQGHADDQQPYDYATDFPASIAELRSIVSEPSLPVIYGSIPITSNQFNKKIRTVHLSYAADPANNAYCFDTSNGDLADNTHMGPAVSLSFATWIAKTYGNIATPPTTQPSRNPTRNVYTNKAAESDTYDQVGAFITKVGTLTSPEQTALQTLETNLRTGLIHGTNIWSKYVAIFPFVGGNASEHQYGLKYPERPVMSFTSATHDANGVVLNGTTSLANAQIRLTDFPFIKSTDFGIVWYQQADNLSVDKVIASIGEHGSPNALLRIWPSYTNGRMRADIGNSSFAMSTVTVTDTRGVASFQTNGTFAQLHKRGNLKGQKAFSTDLDFNGYIQIGWDDVGGGRFYNGTLSFFAVREALTTEEIQDEAAAIQQFQDDLGREQTVVDPPFPASYDDVLAEATLDGVTPETATVQGYQREFLDTLANNLSDGLNGFDLIRIYAGSSSSTYDDFSRYNFVYPSNAASVSGSMDRDDKGWKGDGSAAYMNQNFNPSVDAVNYSLDCGSRIAYVIEAESGSGAVIDGAVTATQNRMFNSNGSHRINTSNALSSAANLAGQGYRSITRVSSTNVELMVDLTKLSRTATSTVIANESITNFRSSSSYGNERLAFYIIGRCYSETEHNFIRAAMRAYLTKLGITP